MKKVTKKSEGKVNVDNSSVMKRLVQSILSKMFGVNLIIKNPTQREVTAMQIPKSPTRHELRFRMKHRCAELDLSSASGWPAEFPPAKLQKIQ